jgi:hypothetical protein
MLPAHGLCQQAELRNRIAPVNNPTYGRNPIVQSANKSTNLKFTRTAAHTYLAAAAVYSFYSWVTQSGLCGYLMDVQLHWFGEGSQNITLVGAMFILGLPAAAIISYIKRKESSTASITNAASPANAPQQQMSWKRFLIISIAPLLISLAVFGLLTAMDLREQQSKIYDVNLNGDLTLPSNDVKYVQLTGAVQLDYQYRLETKGATREKTDTYAPLTGSEWTPKQPIRFFYTDATGYFDWSAKRSRSFAERGVASAKFDGRLTRNSLPIFVENEYRRKGLLIGSPYYVMEQTDFVDGRVPSALGAYFPIPFFGVMTSVLMVVILFAIRKSKRSG